jgi:hypothetical protein
MATRLAAPVHRHPPQTRSPLTTAPHPTAPQGPTGDHTNMLVRGQQHQHAHPPHQDQQPKDPPQPRSPTKITGGSRLNVPIRASIQGATVLKAPFAGRALRARPARRASPAGLTQRLDPRKITGGSRLSVPMCTQTTPPARALTSRPCPNAPFGTSERGSNCGNDCAGPGEGGSRGGLLSPEGSASDKGSRMALSFWRRTFPK